MKFENINEIILSLLLWIASNTDYGDITVNPKVQFLVQSELAELACSRPCEIIAYTPKDSKEKIYLSKNINPTEAKNMVMYNKLTEFNESAKKYLVIKFEKK